MHLIASWQAEKIFTWNWVVQCFVKTVFVAFLHSLGVQPGSIHSGCNERSWYLRLHTVLCRPAVSPLILFFCLLVVHLHMLSMSVPFLDFLLFPHTPWSLTSPGRPPFSEAPSFFFLSFFLASRLTLRFQIQNYSTGSSYLIPGTIHTTALCHLIPGTIHTTALCHLIPGTIHTTALCHLIPGTIHTTALCHLIPGTIHTTALCHLIPGTIHTTALCHLIPGTIHTTALCHFLDFLCELPPAKMTQLAIFAINLFSHIKTCWTYWEKHQQMIFAKICRSCCWTLIPSPPPPKKKNSANCQFLSFSRKAVHAVTKCNKAIFPLLTLWIF